MSQRECNRSLVRDERGASIIIALVFFLICGIIGSVVLTAASVNAKSVQTHKELQQAEFNVSSAAQTIGYDMDMAQLTVIPGTNGTDDSVAVADMNFSLFGKEFWKEYGVAILQQRVAHQSYIAPETLTIEQGNNKVYGILTVDADLNITIELSQSENFDPTSPYNMTVTLQCIPTYDAKGKLASFTYERAVLTKTGAAS